MKKSNSFTKIYLCREEIFRFAVINVQKCDWQ